MNRIKNHKTDRKMKALVPLAALAFMCCLIVFSLVPLYADGGNSINESGGEGIVPVSLTTTNGGIGGCDVVPTRFSISVPTSLPLAMADNGDVVSAEGIKIVNHSYGAVRIKSVRIKAACGWNLVKYGAKNIFAGEKVDSNKLGFLLKIGDGQYRSTENTGNDQLIISSPVRGCYMSGAGDSASCSVALSYRAVITPLSYTVKNTAIASVIFIFEWDRAE